MTTFYKILILCIGFALSNGLWAQSHLDPVDDSAQWVKQYSTSLLIPERSCGIVIAPSFENKCGISLSINCDTLTLIEKRPSNIVYLDSSLIRDIPIKKLAIESDFGKSIDRLIYVAVNKAMPTYSAGLDGCMYYFCASNDSIGETWSPTESTNCGMLVEFVDALKDAIQKGDPHAMQDDWWCSIDKLTIAFQNAPPLPPFSFYKEFGKSKDGHPIVEFSASSPLKGDFLFNAFLTYPMGCASDGALLPACELKSIESVFIDFCKSLIEWKEKTPAYYVHANIIVDDNTEETYDISSKGSSVYLNFTLSSEKYTIENLKEKNGSCIVRYMLENAMPSNAIKQK